MLKGDLKYYSSNKSQNTLYGLMDDNWMGIASAKEITLPPQYQWRL